MKLSKSKSSKKFRYFETLIMIIIAACMIFLNIFTTKKLSALENTKKDAMFVVDQIIFKDDVDFTKEIVEYLPEPYKIIEVYNEDLVLQFHVEFNNNHTISKDDITKYPNLVSILRSHEEGQTTTKIGDVEQDIYFKWISNKDGAKHLVMIYSTIEEVKNLWIFTLVCYIVIVLVFLLLITHNILSYRDKVSVYNNLINIK